MLQPVKQLVLLPNLFSDEKAFWRICILVKGTTTFTAALGAALLFMIQPWVGKVMLPFSGGSFMTWAVTLAFFQAALLAGYLLTHLLSGHCINRVYAALYSAIALFAATSLPADLLSCLPKEYSSPHGPVDQFWLLIRLTGIPVIALATTSVTLQSWWTREHSFEESPWHLYSASNAGSIAGLILYCLAFEVFLPATTIWQIWRYGVYLWAVLMIACAPWNLGKQTTNAPVASDVSKTESWFHWEWFIPAMAGTVTLSAVTNALTLDVPPVPQLWVVPLIIYLVSYILVFRPGAIDLFRWISGAGYLIAFATVATLLIHWQINLGAILQSLLLLMTLFVLNVLAHGALIWRLPENPAQLTGFYLTLAAGGVAGSSFVAFCAPLLFHGMGELPLAIILTACAVWNRPPWRLKSTEQAIFRKAVNIVLLFGLIPWGLLHFLPDFPRLLFINVIAMIFYVFILMLEASMIGGNQVLIFTIIALCLWAHDFIATPGSRVAVLRTYYGIYRIYDLDGIRYFRVGSTFHGHESLKGPDKGRPLFYYHPQTPIGRFFNRTSPTWKNAAIVGLGAGVLAGWAQKGQHIDFFELDPAVVEIARRYFTYIASSPAEIRFFTGDGRLTLRNQPDAVYDLLMLDVFSSDAVPVHLMTREALSEYRRLMHSDGLILFHVSNTTFNLAPLVHAAAKDLGLESRQIQNPAESIERAATTRWVAVGSLSAINRHLSGLSGWNPASKTFPKTPWTDSYSSLLSAWPPDLSMFVVPTSSESLNIKHR
ncbi:MAG: fused MFS/spermidine synthase [Candidatus Riflebacteria bacterium]|nr:fused MFS/spermidine synthase [Candidatus Riflebacteria bacterium]